MAAALAMKRMARERVTLEKPNPDYFVSFKDENLLQFEAYIVGPSETLYEHKFVKVRFEIPQDYPLQPPKCTFIQHTGGRIHPNLYVEGKVCLSILGTWQGEPWALAMTCETVLITIRSLLDNSPYQHEPHQRDHPQFNSYVQYTTWQSLLLDYLDRETDPVLKTNLEKYVSQHPEKMIQELKRQRDSSTRLGTHVLVSPYTGHRGGVTTNYESLLRQVKTAIQTCQSHNNEMLQLNIHSNTPNALPKPTTTNKSPANILSHNPNAVPPNYAYQNPINASINTTITPSFSPAKPKARFSPAQSDPATHPAKKPKTVIDLT